MSDSVLRRAAARFGTPLYLYDFDVIEARVRALRSARSARASSSPTRSRQTPRSGSFPFYARFGLSSDVASRGELAAVRRAGFPPSKILSTGPAKSDADLEALVRARVSIIHAEGEWELEQLEKIGARLRRRVRVGLRLNPPWGIAEKRVIIGGPGAKKFGFDLPTAEKILRVKEEIPASRHLRVPGLQRLERPRRAPARRQHASRAVSRSFTFEEIRRSPCAPSISAAASAFPMPTEREPLDLGDSEKGAWSGGERGARERRSRARPASYSSPAASSSPRPGRTSSRVLGTKRSLGVDYVLVDGGVHHFLRPVLLGTPHKVRLIPGGNATPPDALFTFQEILSFFPVLSVRLSTSCTRRRGCRCRSAATSSPSRTPAPTATRSRCRSSCRTSGRPRPASDRGRLALLRRPPRVVELQAGQKTPF